MTPLESSTSLLLLTAVIVGCGAAQPAPVPTSEASAPRAADARAVQAVTIDVADFETFLLDDEAIAAQRTPVDPVDAGSVVGPLTNDSIRRVMRRYWNEYRSCLERIEDFSAAPGLMTFTIDELGVVTDVTVSGLSEDVSACLVETVRLWVFPRSDFRGIVRYPIYVCGTRVGEH